MQISDVLALTHALAEHPPAGAGAVLVPTMGALHEGHLALVRQAVESGSPVVVSIFVNPTQFDREEDLRSYPRHLERDVELCAEHGVDIVFTPSVEAVYPPGESIVAPPLPAVATTPGLEDAHRPGHFKGVCQVVARLFDLVKPALAVFGEKDYQQLLVIESMVDAQRQRAAARWPGLQITSHPTQRDERGLALSSRNALIPEERRESALGLNRALQAAAAANHPGTAEQLMAEVLRDHDLEIEYAVVRDARTLRPVSSFRGPTRGLIAARLGTVRLIDNRSLPVWS